MRALLYRWFVQYNPAYLLSAAFVFAGCFLWSQGIIHEASLAGILGIPLVAEVYALSLAGGAALLTRIGQRRPAVMLGLIFVVYQWDTTLHTEACAYLGWVGTCAAAIWLVIFIGKIHMLGWALRIRFDRHVWVVAVIAALGLVLAPRVLPELGPRAAGALLAAWIFAIGAFYREGGIASIASLDPWGETVLRRVTKAAWLLSGALVALHAFMWCANAEVSLAPTLLVLPLFAVPRLRSEATAWVLVLGPLLFAAIVGPSAFWVVSMVAAGALSLRLFAPQFSTVSVARPTERKSDRAPYRTTDEHVHTEHAPPLFVTPELGAAERVRCMAGALFAAYLGAWTMRWSHGPWPHHLLLLDLGLALAVAIAAWHTRARASFFVPLAITYGHFVVQARLLPVPASSVAWGETAIAVGFALLGLSLFTSYRLRSPPAPQ